MRLDYVCRRQKQETLEKEALLCCLFVSKRLRLFQDYFCGVAMYQPKMRRDQARQVGRVSCTPRKFLSLLLEHLRSLSDPIVRSSEDK
jgi:hypothetical protein